MGDVLCQAAVCLWLCIQVFLSRLVRSYEQVWAVHPLHCQLAMLAMVAVLQPWCYSLCGWPDA